MSRSWARFLLQILSLALTFILVSKAFATPSPFGIATPDGSSGFGGPLAPVFGWIALRQAEFYKGLTASLSVIKADGSAPWLLLALSFAYGVFHAAGPGHGKAVITSYLIASGDTARRGVTLSFAAAFVQAVVAIVLVAVASIIFRVTAMTMTRMTNWLEVGSYALIVVVGGWLLWTKVRGGHHNHHHNHGPNVPHEDHMHANESHEHHDQHRDHVRAGQHYHVHDRREETGQAPKSIFSRPVSAIMAVGVRPCSGAIIVLVFALSQGLFALGVAAALFMALGTGLAVAVLATLAVTAKGIALRFASADANVAMRVVRGFEISGAGAVLLLGLFLLGGALSTGLPS